MIIFASVVRVLYSSSRTDATLLMSVAPKTLKCQGGSDAIDDEYSTLFELIVAEDRDVLPSHDPRVTYSLEVQLNNERVMTLEGAERDRQKKPRSKRFATNDSGRAHIYQVTSVLCIDRITAKPLTTMAMARMLPPTQRTIFSRSLRQRGRSGAEIHSVAEVDAELAATSGLSTKTRWCIVDMLADMTAPLALLEASTVASALGRPSSLRRLSGVELAALWRYTSDTVIAENDKLPWFACMSIGRFADCMPLAVSHTRRRLHSTLNDQRRWGKLDGANAIDALVASMRLYGSTVGSLHPTFDVHVDADKTLNRMQQLGALRSVGVDDAGATLYSTGRDDELEREAAALLCDPTVARRITVVSAAGDARAIYGSGVRTSPLLNRLQQLDIFSPTEHRVQFVAPTVNHALAVRVVDCDSVDDVLAGRIDEGRPTALCLTFAHCFGLDSFVHTLRFFSRNRRDDPLDDLVLVGDPFSSSGSPRESDRGAPFRDVAAAMRRTALGERQRYESLFGISGAAALGPLDADDHDRLRLRDTPSMPEQEDSYEVYQSIDDVPPAVRDCGLTLVGTASLVEALGQVGSYRDALVLNSHIAFAELGQVARIRSAFRSVYVPTLASTAMSTVGHPIEKLIPTTRNNVYVELDYDDGANTIDHRRCCATALPNVAALSMHAVVHALAGSPARMLARCAPEPIADELAFIVTERTGVEDIRAAFSLVRRRLHLVAAGGAPDVIAALARHAPRPRTRLVDLLVQSSLDGADGHVHMTLLEYSGRYGVVPPVRDADPTSYRLAVLGSTRGAELFQQATGSDGDHVRVSIEQLRRHLFSFLDHGIGGDAAESSDSEADDDVLASRTHRFPVFSAAHVDVSALTTIDFRAVDESVKTRLWALMFSYRIGTLGDDLDDEALEAAARDYPPPLAPVTRQRFLTETRAMRAREAAIVHLLCKIVKGVAETWFIESERRLARTLLGDTDSGRESANRHALAIRRHIDAISAPLPLAAAPEDAYSLYEKLHDLRDYLRERQSAKEHDDAE